MAKEHYHAEGQVTDCRGRSQYRMFGIVKLYRPRAQAGRGRRCGRLVNHVFGAAGGPHCTFQWDIQMGVNTRTPELEAMYALPKGGFPGTQPGWEELCRTSYLGRKGCATGQRSY